MTQQELKSKLQQLIEKTDDASLLKTVYRLFSGKKGYRASTPEEHRSKQPPIYWLRKIAQRGNVAKHIKDPAQWQREQRKDRSLPYRDNK